MYRLVFLTLLVAVAAPGHPQGATAKSYDGLVTLFGQWREFTRPPMRGGVPDYSATAMAAQKAALPEWRARLAAIETRGLSAAQRSDHAVVGAEMAGLDFDHRVRRPWERDPAFYRLVYASQSDTPSPEGVAGEGALEVWRYAFPVQGAELDDVRTRLRAGPGRLQQARVNLRGEGRDLWLAGIGVFRDQIDVLDALAARLASAQPELAPDASTAADAARTFLGWLELELPKRQGPSGVGMEAYDWHARHVRLSPYTWADQVAILERELARAQSSLHFEELRNRDLPPLTAVTTADEHDRRSQQAVTDFLSFARHVFTIEPFMDAALRAEVGRFLPSSPPREFFREVDHHDPLPMRVHDVHWIELERMQRQPHLSPIRRVPLLFNIWVDRAEGIATGLEEHMLVAGLYDQRPRSRELVWILLAQRAARGLGDLMMHANRWTLDEAAKFTVGNTPRGFLRVEGRTVWREQQLYLQQPGYGTSYVIGKVELDALLAERMRADGKAFSMVATLDAIQAAGMIPLSLIRTELSRVVSE